MTIVTSTHVARVEARLEQITDECLSFGSAYQALAPSEALDASAQTSTPLVLSLDHVSTVAEAKAFSPDLPLRLMVWNVANLGGKFGYPVERHKLVIEATARIIHAAKADAVIILEVLQHSSKTPQPRKPLLIEKETQREAKDPVLNHLIINDVLPGAARNAGADSLPNLFFQLVNALIWPIVRNDTQTLEEQQREKQQEQDAARDALPLHARLPFQRTCDAVLAALVASASLVISKEEEEEEEDDDAEPGAVSAHQRKRWDELGDRPDHTLIPDEYADDEDLEPYPLSEDPPQLKWIRQGMLLLGFEGQKNFLEEAWNEAKPASEKSRDSRLRTARNNQRKLVVDALRDLLKELWSPFLDAYHAELESNSLLPKAANTGRGSRRGTDSAPPRDLSQGRWYYFIGMTAGPRMAAYDAAMVKWRELNDSTNSKSAKHPGLSEFVNIAAELTKLDPDFGSWPTDENDVKYHLGETYGVLWRKSRLEPESAPQFLKDAVGSLMPSLTFDKRQPVRARFKLKDDAGHTGPELDLVGWHAPAPSTANKAARSTDFPSFVSFTEEARKSGTMGVLLSDLNINTQGRGTSIEHCATQIDRIGFFEDVIGRKGLSRLGKRAQFDRQSKTYSTMAKTKFFDEADSEEDFIVRMSEIVGASSYDKILPFSRHGKDWKLYLRRFSAIPIPITLRAGTVAGDPFESVDRSTDEVLLAYNKLFEAHPGIRDKLLEGAKPGSKKDEQKRAYVHGARKLSDHFPVLADFVVRHTRVKEAAARAGTTAVPVAPSVEDDRRRLSEWCVHLQNSAGTPYLASAFEALMSFWHRATSLHTDRESLALLEAALTASTLDDSARGAPENAGPWLNSLSRQPVAPSRSFATLPETLETLDNAGGGDCLFRALGQLLFSDEDRHLEIRWALVAWLRSELGQAGTPGRMGSATRAAFLEHLRAMHADLAASWPGLPLYRTPVGIEILESWAAQMEAPGTWGDTLALALASAYFNVHFGVWLTEDSHTVHQPLSFADDPEGGRPRLALWCRDFVHFQACPPRAVEARVAVAPPSSFSDLAKRRVVAPIVVPVMPPPVTDSTLPPGRKAKTVPPDVRVHLWPTSDPWSPEDADENAEALFLFTESHALKGRRLRVNTGQAVLRLSENAVGIRTFESEAVANDDGQLSRNQGWFEEDLQEARRRLGSGRYRTLILPWDDVNARCALGIDGGHDLSALASASYQALVERIKELYRWADANLQRVMVVPRWTELSQEIAMRNSDCLFVVPTLLPIWEASRRGAFLRDINSSAVRALPVLPSPLRNIAPHPDEEQRLVNALKEALTLLKKQVATGHYRTIEVLGDKAQDKTHLVLAAETLMGMSYHAACNCLVEGWKELEALAAATPYQPVVTIHRVDKRKLTEPAEKSPHRIAPPPSWTGT